MKIDSPIKVVIHYESGRQITLGQEDAAKVLSLYMSQRKDTGAILGDISFVEAPKKESLFKKIDNFIEKLLTWKIK